ncbi:MAG: type I-E CRISPR-associated protein Cse2/CasB [Anaerolineae bacterium]|nr:type I-E CRISPR-associated protein Cse2/CasB [Anaerolineae bacterium]
MRTDDRRIVLFSARLAALSAAERARLRRNAGKSLAESHEAIGLFFRLLPYGVPNWDEHWFFLVATLYPLTTLSRLQPFGVTLRHVDQVAHSHSFDRRVEVLINATPQQLPYRLRQIIKLAGSRHIAVHWPSLLADLTHWTHPDRFVQLRWARDYFHPQGE